MKIEGDYKAMLKRKAEQISRSTKAFYARLRAGTATEKDFEKLEKIREGKKKVL